jgi:hypothetical protein
MLASSSFLPYRKFMGHMLGCFHATSHVGLQLVKHMRSFIVMSYPYRKCVEGVAWSIVEIIASST